MRGREICPTKKLITLLRVFQHITIGKVDHRIRDARNQDYFPAPPSAINLHVGLPAISQEGSQKSRAAVSGDPPLGAEQIEETIFWFYY